MLLPLQPAQEVLCGRPCGRPSNPSSVRSGAHHRPARVSLPPVVGVLAGSVGCCSLLWHNWGAVPRNGTGRGHTRLTLTTFILPRLLYTAQPAAAHLLLIATPTVELDGCPAEGPGAVGFGAQGQLRGQLQKPSYQEPPSSSPLPSVSNLSERSVAASHQEQPRSSLLRSISSVSERSVAASEYSVRALSEPAASEQPFAAQLAPRAQSAGPRPLPLHTAPAVPLGHLGAEPAAGVHGSSSRLGQPASQPGLASRGGHGGSGPTSDGLGHLLGTAAGLGGPVTRSSQPAQPQELPGQSLHRAQSFCSLCGVRDPRGVAAHLLSPLHRWVWR